MGVCQTKNWEDIYRKSDYYTPSLSPSNAKDGWPAAINPTLHSVREQRTGCDSGWVCNTRHTWTTVDFSSTSRDSVNSWFSPRISLNCRIVTHTMHYTTRFTILFPFTYTASHILCPAYWAMPSPVNNQPAHSSRMSNEAGRESCRVIPHRGNLPHPGYFRGTVTGHAL